MASGGTMGSMPDTVERPQDIWNACVGHGALPFDVHDQVAWQRDRRMEGYALWRLSPPTADSLSRTLLALRLYALSHDAAVTTGQPLSGEELAGLPLAGVMSAPRPHYELFAGLTSGFAAGLGPPEPDAVRAHALNVLRLLSYEKRGGALALARLDAGIGTVLSRLAERYRNPGLTARDLEEAADRGPAG